MNVYIYIIEWSIFVIINFKKKIYIYIYIYIFINHMYYIILKLFNNFKRLSLKFLAYLLFTNFKFII